MKDSGKQLLRSKSEQGQILLIVVLATVVSLTVGLSIASRTITNIKISKQNEESQRAFQAAEAGIEQALKETGAVTSFSTQFLNNSSSTTTIVKSEGTQFILNGGEEVNQDIGADVFLSKYPDYTSPITGTLTIYWGTSGQDCLSRKAPALEAIVLSGNTKNPTLSKAVFDPCGRIPGSAASAGSGSVQATSFNYSGVVSVSQGLVMKVIPLYNSSVVGISSTVALPSQGQVIESVGKSADTTRKVIYYSTFPQLPTDLFPYAIISQ